MLSFILSLVFLFCSPIPTSSLPLLDSPDSAVGVLWTFPNETFIENIAVRQNGEILCTSLDRAALYSVNPFSHVASTIHQFDQNDGTLGIAEIEQDVFVVTSANVSIAGTATAGSAKMWKADLSKSEPEISLIANLTDVGLPDDIATLDSTNGLVLLADPAKGLVWRVDTTTGDHAVAISTEALVATQRIPLGVDGLHILNDYLFFTNLGNGFLGRIPIYSNGSARGPAEVIANMTRPDSFTVANDGTAYIAGDNSLYKVGLNGTVNVLAGGDNDTTLEGSTSARFGRTSLDQDVVYIGTNGGIPAPVGSIRGGQVLAINVGLFQ